jgi:hypothetical protein
VGICVVLKGLIRATGKFIVEDPTHSSGMQGIRNPAHKDSDGDEADEFYVVQDNGSVQRIK